jgi:hypothetical protein
VARFVLKAAHRVGSTASSTASVAPSKLEDAKEFALANSREPGSLEVPDGFRIREAGMIEAEVIINPSVPLLVTPS